MSDLNGHGRNGCAKPPGVNGLNRLAGIALSEPPAAAAAPLKPSPTAAAPPPAAPDKAQGNGRGAGGFAVGNHYGKGNPHARRMASLREAFLSAATEERMRELGEKLFAAALAGDWQAAKLLLPFVIGRPADAADPDTLDRDEWLQCQEWPEEPFPFAWLRKRSFAEAVSTLRNLAERGQAEIVRLAVAEANADD